MASRHIKNGNKKKDKLVAMHYAKFVAPHLMASFALTLYDKTDMSVDDIADMCVEVNDLWNRASQEGWDIVKNCEDLTGINMKSWIEVREHEKRVKKGADDGKIS